jgi:hypothetical protein
MRHLLVCACVCLFVICGIDGARPAVKTIDEVPSGLSTAPELSALKEPSGLATTAKPIVARSDREICDTLIASAQSNELPIPFFIRLLFQESGFKPDVVSRAGAPGHRSIHARDRLKGRTREPVRSDAGNCGIGATPTRSRKTIRQSWPCSCCLQRRPPANSELAGAERQAAR